MFCVAKRDLYSVILSNVSPMRAINMLNIVICVKKVAQRKMVIVKTDIIG